MEVYKVPLYVGLESMQNKPRLTKHQEQDLETILYFLPIALKDVEIAGEDIQDFFAYSERGIKRGDEKSLQIRDGYHALLEGKRWRGIHMEMWEDGVMDCGTPYHVLLGSYGDVPPRSVVDFMKREMFKGKDAEVIEQIYAEYS